MLRHGLIIATVVAILDQITKYWAIDALTGANRVVEVTSYFNLVMVWNRGVSFGMMGGGAVPPWLLAAVSAAVAAGLTLWLSRLDQRWLGAGVGLIIGGAVGNVIDRVVYGAVADFLDFHLAGHHWPAFNVADSAITVGVAILVIDSLLIRGRSTK